MIKKVLGLGLVALALAACGDKVHEITPILDGPAAATSATTAPASPTPDPLLKKVGEIARWEDGATAAVASLKKYTPSGSAAGHQPGNLAFEASVTIGTTTSTPLDLSLASVQARAGAQGAQCEALFDSAKGVSGTFQGTVSGGRSVTVRMAWSCPADAGLGQIALQVQPTWNHNPATFEGGVA